MRFFFYGTLMDDEVRGAVLDERSAAEPAVLAGWRRVRKPGTPYPIVVRARGRRVAGVLVRGLDGRARARLIAFEDDGYALALLPVNAGGRRRMAWVFAAKPGTRLGRARRWNVAEWRKTGRGPLLARLGRGNRS